MTDPLGGSQVLPYLTGLAALGHRISLISFEKPERSEAEVTSVRATCAASGIAWHPLQYHKRPPILSAVYDVGRMRRLSERLHKREHFDIVHCRSYLPALIGLSLKRRFGIGFLFDMRGFWADERVDGKIWNLANPLFRMTYDFFKRREADFLREADHVVSLTEAGRTVLLARPDRAAEGPPISVIPCCVDFDVFPAPSAKGRDAGRRDLGIPAGRRVLAYLGSIGSWYMLDEMLDFHAVQLERDPDALFLLITRNDPRPILALAEAKGIPAHSLTVRGGQRHQVSLWLGAVDYGLFFVKRAFSKVAMSPTKLGEYLAAGIPVISNTGIGDVATVIAESQAGVLIENFDRASYQNALDRLEKLPKKPEQWRERARKWFDLDAGVARYDEIYGSIGSSRAPIVSRRAPARKSYEFASRDTCPACRGNQVVTLYCRSFSEPPIGDFIKSYYNIDPRVLDARPYQLDRCRSCHLVFQKFVGEVPLLSDLYTHWVTNLEHPENDDRYREDIQNIRLSRDAHEIMAAASFLGKPLSELSSLDYGMGWALWARIAQQLGCKSYGSDLSRPRMEFAASQAIIPIEDDEIAAHRFDFINTEQVFEHVPDPAALLDRLAASLAPGGVVKISVPSGDRVDDIVRKLNDGSFTGDTATIMPVHPLEHVNTFVRKSIDVMATNIGLEIVQPSYFHRFAFLGHRGSLNPFRPLATARELVRPWYQFRNPANIYVWLRAKKL